MSIYGNGIGYRITISDIITEVSFKNELYNEFPKIDNVEIWIHPLEGYNIPHFHIQGNNFNCAVCLYDNKFFIHPHAKDKLKNKKQKEFLCEILDTPPKNNDNPLWIVLCSEWDRYKNTNLFDNYLKDLESKGIDISKIENIRPDYKNMYQSIHN